MGWQVSYLWNSNTHELKLQWYLYLTDTCNTSVTVCCREVSFVWILLSQSLKDQVNAGQNYLPVVWRCPFIEFSLHSDFNLLKVLQLSLQLHFCHKPARNSHTKTDISVVPLRKSYKFLGIKFQHCGKPEGLSETNEVWIAWFEIKVEIKPSLT